MDGVGGWNAWVDIERLDTNHFIPSYRRLGLYTAFLKQWLPYMEALGYERVTTTHHPNNRAILIAELKAGFDIVGLELHESHGLSVRMAYFVHNDRRRGFEDVFSMVPSTTPKTRTNIPTGKG